MKNTKIDAFFIYDEDIKKTDKSMSDEELQEEKLIYYYPDETDNNIKVSHTSMMEGVSVFINQFNKSHTDHIITNDFLIVINRWYKRIFVTIVVNNIYKNTNMELLMCKFLHSVLCNFTSIFTLLHGNIRNFIRYKKYNTPENINKKKTLQSILSDYVFTYINTINNENISIHHELQSFYFFPVERHTYITVQTLISSLILDNKQIKHGAFFYEGHMVYSSLPMNDMKIIYNYLVSYSGTVSLYIKLFIPLQTNINIQLTVLHYLVNNLKLSEFPFKKIASSAALNTNGGLSSFARSNSIEDKHGFLMGIKKSFMFMPVITLSTNKKYKLVVFIFKGILIMLLIKGSIVKDEDFDTLLDIQNKCTNENSNNIYKLTNLNDILKLQYKKYISNDDYVKYFYHNKINNSVKYSINNKKINNEEMFLVARFHFLLNESQIKYKKNKNKKKKLKDNQVGLSHYESHTNTRISTNINKNENFIKTDLSNFEQNFKNTKPTENKEKQQPTHDNKNIQTKKNNEFDKFNDKKNNNKNDKIEESKVNYTSHLHDKEQTKGKINVDTKENNTSSNTHLDAQKNLHPDVQKKQTQKTNLNIINTSDKNNKKLKLIINEELKKKIFDYTCEDIEIEKIFFKEASCPWIFSTKNLQRELFILPDDLKMSLTKAQNEIDKIMDMNFSKIYI
ncbi:conserved protein, unknown function [Hepatocystis sp. ex Piliocolobus tephrosceles]|nr:conserved protein, unknown function [Hepatocystis sp. ex Piliocolobus tephrosceles]